MKVVRFLLFIAAAAVLLLAGLAGLAFTPAVQTWVLRREIEPPPGTSMAVGRVAIGLHHVRIEQLAISDPGTTVTLPLIEADLPVLSAIGRNVQLGNLIAKGWTIDLTQAAPAPAAGPGEAGGNAAPQPGPPLASAARAIPAVGSDSS